MREREHTSFAYVGVCAQNQELEIFAWDASFTNHYQREGKIELALMQAWRMPYTTQKQERKRGILHVWHILVCLVAKERAP